VRLVRRECGDIRPWRASPSGSASSRSRRRPSNREVDRRRSRAGSPDRRPAVPRTATGPVNAARIMTVAATHALSDFSLASPGRRLDETVRRPCAGLVAVALTVASDVALRRLGSLDLVTDRPALIRSRTDRG